MWCNRISRINATKHKINCLEAFYSSFGIKSEEYAHLRTRVNMLRRMLNDSTYVL